MVEIILQIIMMGGAFIAGYGVRELTHPEQKRDKKGRFTKD
jgi:hypothetical protein